MTLRVFLSRKLISLNVNTAEKNVFIGSVNDFANKKYDTTIILISIRLSDIMIRRLILRYFLVSTLSKAITESTPETGTVPILDDAKNFDDCK